MQALSSSRSFSLRLSTLARWRRRMAGTAGKRSRMQKCTLPSRPAPSSMFPAAPRLKWYGEARGCASASTPLGTKLFRLAEHAGNGRPPREHHVVDVGAQAEANARSRQLVAQGPGEQGAAMEDVALDGRR